MLSTVTNTNIDIVRGAVKLFQQLSLLEILDDQTIFVIDTNKMLGESSSTERVKRFRNNKKILELSSSENKGNVTEALHETEIEKELEKETEINKEKKIKIGVFDLYSSDDLLLKQALKDFDSMRRSKSPMTDRARQLLCTELDKLKEQGQDRVECINQSILNGWKSVYAVKQGKGRNEPIPDYTVGQYPKVESTITDEEVEAFKERLKKFK
jgi:hypothetical protein